MTAAKLIRPSAEYKESFLEAIEEYHAEGRYLYNEINILKSDFEGFVKILLQERGYPHQPYQDWVDPVPETVTWMVKDGNYLGTVDIRHRLNWHLEKWGGNINFVIRPSMRGKGFGRKILLKAMPIANHLGVERALITVAPDNKPAIRIIEICGGIFEDSLPETAQFPARERFFLDCS
jgi:predicted acetyltransferase